MSCSRVSPPPLSRDAATPSLTCQLASANTPESQHVANIKSQIKRNRQNEAAHERNKSVKSALKSAVRRFREAAVRLHEMKVRVPADVDDASLHWKRGVSTAGLQLIAEAPDESEAIEVLHRAGYAIYVRQDIYRLGRRRDTVLAEPLLRACQSGDEWGVQQLYHNTVPRLAQLADSAPRMYRSGAVRGYVLEDQQEVAAYLQVRRGPDGAWFSLLLHPRAEARAAAIIEYGLSLFGPNWNAPIYCGVRRYQEWLSHPLESLGFEHHGSTVVMVKHLVSLIQEPEAALVPGLEKVTAPLAHPRG